MLSHKASENEINTAIINAPDETNTLLQKGVDLSHLIKMGFSKDKLSTLNQLIDHGLSIKSTDLSNSEINNDLLSLIQNNVNIEDIKKLMHLDQDALIHITARATNNGLSKNTVSQVISEKGAEETLKKIETLQNRKFNDKEIKHILDINKLDPAIALCNSTISKKGIMEKIGT